VASITAIASEPTFQLIRVPKSICKPLVSSLVIFACDMLAIATSVCLTLLGSHLGGEALDFSRYFALWPSLGLFAAIFATLGLYPGVIHNAVAELRRLVLGVTISFIMIEALLFVTRSPLSTPCEVIILCWIATLVITPVMRSVVRELLCRKPWWGTPVAVFYTGPESTELIKQLERHPEFGLRPVAILSPHGAVRATHLPPVLDMRYAAAVRACGVERAIIALPDAKAGKLLEDLEHFESLFPRLIIMHGSTAIYTLTADARDIGGSLAVEVRRDLLLTFPRMVKRVIDVSIVCLTLPVCLMVLLLGVLVKFDSPGPIFYGHRRIGRNNSTFRAWKLRTMRVNCDEILRDALAADPALREEWYRDRKLRNDPRVTRIGRILRRTSLDELPQLWNVVVGEMSLVGPRPIVEEEVPIYGCHFPLYCRVAPGITGLWQVSGRNTIGLADRVRLDTYYVRNWSPWLDLHILARTVRAVMAGEGAY
jgi:Undecaprenyl-phosphate galactose phosphotransferase WbaP